MAWTAAVEANIGILTLALAFVPVAVGLVLSIDIALGRLRPCSGGRRAPLMLLIGTFSLSFLIFSLGFPLGVFSFCFALTTIFPPLILSTSIGTAPADSPPG